MKNPIILLKSIHLLYFCFVTLGFNRIYYSLPLFIIYYLLRLGNARATYIGKNYAISSFILFIFIFLTFALGFNEMKLGEPVKTFAAIIFSLLFSGYALQGENTKTKIILMGCYLFGVFLNSFIIVVYSFVSDSSAYGYGRLISPFGDVELNSPSVSNMLALVLVFFYYYIFFGKKGVGAYMAFAVVLLSVASAFFLAGRTFFVILFLAVIYYSVVRFSLILFLKMISFFGLLLIIGVNLLSEYSDLARYFEFIQLRFDSGLESNRFRHFAYGLEMLMSHPFGGFSVDRRIEDTMWLHNILLDSGRVAGWAPIAIFCLFLAYVFKTIRYGERHQGPSAIFPTFLASLFILFQDVVLEGEYRSLIVLYLSALILLPSHIKANGISVN